MTLSAASRSIAIELAAASAGTREFRHLPFRRLSLGTRERRTNQSPMHGAFVFSGDLLNLVLGRGWRFLRMLSRFFCARWLFHRHLFWDCVGRRGFLRGMFGR